MGVQGHLNISKVGSGAKHPLLTCHTHRAHLVKMRYVGLPVVKGSMEITAMNYFLVLHLVFVLEFAISCYVLLIFNCPKKSLCIGNHKLEIIRSHMNLEYFQIHFFKTSY
jgi:hypothetical protein